jgi:hypothetical protein
MKRTLLDIKRTTDVTTHALAERARLPVADVFTVETGGFCTSQKAQQVVTAFNQLSGMHITVEDIALHESLHSQEPMLPTH